MITIEFSEREWHAVVGALRTQEESHKRNDFKALVLEMQEIRSRMNDAMIDRKLVVG
jgi:hypothetical protein